jgi:hypothetical protein
VGILYASEDMMMGAGARSLRLRRDVWHGRLDIVRQSPGCVISP